MKTAIFGKSTNLADLILIFFLALFFWKSLDLFIANSLPLVSNKPLEGEYSSDEFVFLRTFYLIKEGDNYYHAFNDAVVNDNREGHLTKDVLAWRLPTAFYFWTLLAHDGFGIGLLFIACSTLTLLLLNKIASIFLPPFLSILSPILAAPYFLDVYYYKTSFLFTEWWGLFFFVFGLASLLYRKNNLTVLFFSLAILTREMFLVPIIFMALISLLLKVNRQIFVKIIIIFLVFYAAHAIIVQSQDVINVARNPVSRIHFFSISQFQREIAFSMRQYPLLNLRLPWIIVIVSSLTFIFKIINNRNKSNILKIYLYLFCSFFPLLIITPFIGVDLNDYWGILFMPICIALLPSVLSKKILIECPS